MMLARPHHSVLARLHHSVLARPHSHEALLAVVRDRMPIRLLHVSGVRLCWIARAGL